MTLTLYGIPNCDTVKKATRLCGQHWFTNRTGRPRNCDTVKWLDRDWPTITRSRAPKVAGWVAQAGLERVLNKAGTTFRKLPDADKADLTTERPWR
jgi:arsenate reductase-like glutaredoxin family protein